MISYNLDSIFRPLNEPLCSGGSSQLIVLLAQGFAYLFLQTCDSTNNLLYALVNKINRNPLKASQFAKKRRIVWTSKFAELQIMTFSIRELNNFFAGLLEFGVGGDLNIS